MGVEQRTPVSMKRKRNNDDSPDFEQASKKQKLASPGILLSAKKKEKKKRRGDMRNVSINLSMNTSKIIDPEEEKAARKARKVEEKKRKEEMANRVEQAEENGIECVNTSDDLNEEARKAEKKKRKEEKAKQATLAETICIESELEDSQEAVIKKKKKKKKQDRDAAEATLDKSVSEGDTETTKQKKKKRKDKENDDPSKSMNGCISVEDIKEELISNEASETAFTDVKKKKKKKKSVEPELQIKEEPNLSDTEDITEETPKKKKKKQKKSVDSELDITQEPSRNDTGDVTEETTKKKKKKSVDNEVEEPNWDENRTEETPKKKKKKRKEKESNDVNNSSNQVDDSILHDTLQLTENAEDSMLNSSDSVVTKKKKSKEKHSNSQNEKNEEHIESELDTSESQHKKKKKKSKVSVENKLNSEHETAIESEMDTSESQHKKKSKKSKERVENSEHETTIDSELDTSESQEKKKKRKKSKEATENNSNSEHETTIEPELDTSESQQKKKKKKKSKESEENKPNSEHESTIESEMDTSESLHKKKKKTKSKESVQNRTILGTIEIIPSSIKQLKADISDAVQRANHRGNMEEEEEAGQIMEAIQTNQPEQITNSGDIIEIIDEMILSDRDDSVEERNISSYITNNAQHQQEEEEEEDEDEDEDEEEDSDNSNNESMSPEYVPSESLSYLEQAKSQDIYGRKKGNNSGTEGRQNGNNSVSSGRQKGSKAVTEFPEIDFKFDNLMTCCSYLNLMPWEDSLNAAQLHRLPYKRLTQKEINELAQQGIIVKRGRWQKEEEHRLCMNFKAFVEAHKSLIDFDAFDLVISRKELFQTDREEWNRIIEFRKNHNFRACLAFGLERDLELVTKKASNLLNKNYCKGCFSSDQVKQLQELIEIHGESSICKIASIMKRTPQAISDKIDHEVTNRNTGSWTAKEDERLRKMVHQVQTESEKDPMQPNSHFPWSKVLITGRNKVQCRARWMKHLGVDKTKNKQVQAQLKLALVDHLEKLVSKTTRPLEDRAVDWDEVTRAVGFANRQLCSDMWRHMKYNVAPNQPDITVQGVLSKLPSLVTLWKKKAGIGSPVLSTQASEKTKQKSKKRRREDNEDADSSIIHPKKKQKKSHSDASSTSLSTQSSVTCPTEASTSLGTTSSQTTSPNQRAAIHEISSSDSSDSSSDSSSDTY